MYVDCLDLSTMDFTGTGGPPPAHRFVVSAMTYDAVKTVLAADRVTDTKYGKLKFTTFVAEWTHRPTGCRGRYDYNSSQDLPDTQDELDGDAALNKDDDDDMENMQRDTDDDEHVEIHEGGKKGKAATDVPSPKKVKEHIAVRGKVVSPSKRGRAPEDVGQGSPGKRSRTDPVAARRRVKKTTTRATTHIIRDPLERLHSKLSTCGNSDVHEAPVDKIAAAPSTVPTSSDASGRPSPPVVDAQATTIGIHTSGSDESISARTAEILPTLLAMKDADVRHATLSSSVEVDAPETNLSKEDSRSSDTDSKRVGGGTPVSMTEVAEATVHNDMPSTGTPEEISPSLDEVYRRIEEAALQTRSSRGQEQSSSYAPAETVSKDTIRSATPGSVRQQRVVHPPPVDDYEPEVKATKEQNQLYDIVKRFGNARSNSKHMKELKA
ncbi:hypothetical protein VPH35_068887 [Triticum aestivum]